MLASASARAATLTWSGTSGATWGTDTTNWTGSGGSTPWDSTTGTTNVARFSTASALANVSTSVTVNGIFATAAATIQGGTISIGGASPTITSTNAAVLTINSVLSGSPFTKAGDGTLVLGGANALNAGTVTIGSGSVNAGYLRLTSSQALGSVTTINLPTTNAGVSGVQLEGGVSMPSTLNITSAGRTASLALTTGYTLKNNSGNNTWNGNISVSAGGGSNGIVSDSGTLTITGTLMTALTGTLSTRAFLFGGGGDFLVSGRVIDSLNGNANLSVTKSDAGTLILSGSNTYTGNTTINGGTLQIGNGGATGSLSVSSTITVASGATLAFKRSNTITQGTDFISVISGTGGVAQLGSGTLALTGVNTYSGRTLVSAGVLTVGANGSFANSNEIKVGDAGSSGAVLDLTAKAGGFTFGSGQTVSGIGTITIGAGATVTSNGIWAPGNSIGSNAVTGNLALSGTSQFELGTPGTSATAPGNADFTAVSGTLTLGGNLVLLDNSGSNSQGSYGAGSYQLFTAPTVSGTFASVTAPVGATTTRVGMVYTSGTASGQGVFANVYNLASAASTQTVNLGNARIGTGTTAAVTLANLSPVSANYTETLSTGSFSSTTAGFTASGSASDIIGGGTGSGTLLVGLGGGLAAGAQTGTTTLALFSNAVISSGLAQQSIGSQTITITGTLFNPASANSLPASVTLGNIRVGSAFGTQSLSIWNTGSAATAFQEGLNASIASTAGSASGSGSITNLSVAGGTSTALSVGLGAGNQGTAGVVSGTATIGFATNGTLSGLSNASLASQNVAVSGTVFNMGAANTLSAVTLQNIRVGGSFTNQALTITNTAANNGFSEGLNAAVTGTTGGASWGGSGILNLAAGGTSNSLTVGLGGASTATAGLKTGTAAIQFATNGTNTSGLGTLVTGTQSIAVSGAAYDFAQANYTGGALAFGNVRTGASVTAQTVAIGNQTVTNANFQDLLNVSGSTTNSAVTATGFTGLAASAGGTSTQNLSLSANAATAGSLASTVSLTLVSNANGVAGLSNGTAAVVGSPAAITTTGGVYDFAQAKFSGATLAFGVVHKGASVSSQSVAFGNQTVTNANYQDSLDVSATTGNARVTATGFTGLAASGSGSTTNNLTVSVSTATAGSLASTLALTLTSNANGVDGLSNGTANTIGGGSITTTGGVFSGTGSWNQATGGSWGTGANANWTSVESVAAAPGTFADYANTDAAIFGSAVSSGTASIKLDGAQVSLASIKFDNATARYVIESGTGAGSFALAAFSGKPVVDVVGIHEIAAAISGTSGLQKTGLGKLILSGSSNYSGGTDITAGTLAVNGFLGGAVNVANGAILGGSGTLNGPVTVAAGGILAPGNSPGTLTMDSGLVLDAASILNFELNAANFTIGGGINDLIVVTGDFTLDGILNVSGIGDFSTVADNTKWRLFNYSGGTFTDGGLSLGSMPSVGATGKYFQIDTSTAGQVNLVIATVPEPESLALAGIGIAAAVWAARRRK